MTKSEDPNYALGRTDDETERLIQQNIMLTPATRMMFDGAGMKNGMKVLDVGTGAGDLALLAAGIVGPTGSVVGVDSNSEILKVARRRAEAARLQNIEFIEGDLRTSELPGDFDFVVGRLVLLYLANPLAGIRAAVDRLRPGGVIAFQEWDSTILHDHFARYPGLRLFQQTIRWILAAFQSAGVDTELGSKLYRLFLEAGLPAPTMFAYTPMGGPADWPGFSQIADILPSVQPVLTKSGIATVEEVQHETLARRLQEEVIANRVPMQRGTFVSAWATKVTR